MHCKSLWIKASAKCINVNVVNTELIFTFSFVATLSGGVMIDRYLYIFIVFVLYSIFTLWYLLQIDIFYSICIIQYFYTLVSTPKR